MSAATARVPTAHASLYLQQLCKHWAHKMEVTFDAQAGRIAFPNGAVATLAAEADALSVRVEAAEADLARMQQVVAEHLDRFAFREAPLAFAWRRADTVSTS